MKFVHEHAPLLQPKPPKEDKGPPPPFEPWLAIRKGECKPIKVCH